MMNSPFSPPRIETGCYLEEPAAVGVVIQIGIADFFFGFNNFVRFINSSRPLIYGCALALNSSPLSGDIVLKPLPVRAIKVDSPNKKSLTLSPEMRLS
jgi:hypothetical protein